MTPHVELVQPQESTVDSGIAALRTERGNLPLDAVDLHATITGLTVRTTLTQRFRNPFGEPLEAVYIFPLPDRAAVTTLRLEADDRVVEGVLRERGQARADFAAAVAEGRRASLLEEDRPGVFTMRVGNILPGERVTVTVGTVGQLPYEDGVATFRFPLVVAPRYIPGHPLPGGAVGDGVAPDTDAVPDASRISPPVLLPGFPNPVRLSALVDVDPAGFALNSIQSTLPVAVDGGTLRLVPDQRLDRDFVLRLPLGDADSVAASLAVEPDAEGGTFALTVLPPVSGATPKPRDVVLVLDRSGSMGGWKIAAARRAAARIVDTLTAADRFAVLAFDHEVAHPEQLPRGLVAANDRNRFRAVTHLSAMTARGGTEMLAPLREAAGLLADSGRDLVLVLVTDGQVGNEDQILHALAPRLGSIRVHTVGVDSAVNAAFLRRLADASGGRCELVESEDRLDDAMRAIHHRIAAPLVTDLTVTGDGVATDTIAPARLPDLFPGAAVLVSGRCSATDAVRVSGRLADGTPWHTTVSAVRGENAGLAATWARARIRELEDRYVTAPAVAPDLEREIVAVSLRYGVLSRFTAFVAVDQRVVTEGGQRHQVVQPVDLPHGWDHDEVAVAASAPWTLTSARFTAARASGRPVAHSTRLKRAPRAASADGVAPRRTASLVPSSVEAFVTHALRRLAELAGRPESERSRWLAKLAADIRRRLSDFRADGLPERGVRALTDLADTLEQPGDLADRWQRAETTLRALTDRRSGPFWAR